MPLSETAKAYYAAHTRTLRDHSATNASRFRPRQALQHTTVNGAKFLPFPSRLPDRPVTPAVRSALKQHLVHEYDVAARNGSPLRIVYIRHAPGTWSGRRRETPGPRRGGPTDPHARGGRPPPRSPAARHHNGSPKASAPRPPQRGPGRHGPPARHRPAPARRGLPARGTAP
ncbi:hypothetical protein ACQKM2_13560 [Streptomyces sp. NPDC004126]|uniref:hypothetical protein n=1 Tax=Streptomyces sp. NPDC004126 TaxID=3390695 RepID=UPI003D0663B3